MSLQKKIEELNKEHEIILGFREYEKKIAKLEAKLVNLNKALKLACERVKYFEEMQDKEMGHYELFGYENEYDLQAIVKYYINKAKENKDD